MLAYCAFSVYETRFQMLLRHNVKISSDLMDRDEWLSVCCHCQVCQWWVNSLAWHGFCDEIPPQYFTSDLHIAVSGEFAPEVLNTGYWEVQTIQNKRLTLCKTSDIILVVLCIVSQYRWKMSEGKQLKLHTYAKNITVRFSQSTCSGQIFCHSNNTLLILVKFAPHIHSHE